jgi:hypothetical protein
MDGVFKISKYLFEKFCLETYGYIFAWSVVRIFSSISCHLRRYFLAAIKQDADSAK